MVDAEELSRIRNIHMEDIRNTLVHLKNHEKELTRAKDVIDSEVRKVRDRIEKIGDFLDEIEQED